jgi:hypothetical protein
MSNSPNYNSAPLSRNQVLIAMGFTAIVLLIISKVWLYFGQMQLLPVTFTWGDGLIGMMLGLSITGISSLIYRFSEQYRRSANLYLDVVLKPLIIPDLLWLGLLPGLSEELLFRGVMFPSFGLDWFGLIISALCFGSLHMTDWQQWSYGVWATIVGIILGLSLLLTGNLLVPIVAHIIANFISGLTWKLGKFAS